MGKSKKKAQQQVTLYYMSIHYGVCTAVDKVLGIFAKEKEAWTGEVSTPTTISINKQELFGGVKKEGGLLGSVHIMPGTETQTMPAALAQKMGRSGSSDCPAYRGITSLFFYRNSFTQGFYWSANAPYVPAVWCKVERAPVGLDPQYAMIEASNAAAPDISGKTYEVTWWQNSYDQALDDQGRMGWGFVDADENLIGSIDWSTYTAPLTWTERTHSAVAPSGAAYARLYVGANRRTGTNNDARFDAITATVDGQPLFVANGSAETGDTSGWTPETGTIVVRAADGGYLPTPDDGEYYFRGGTTDTVIVYQQLGQPGADANPAHIIYECLTNVVWGMGTPAAAIDYDAFDAASQTLFAESFGLSLLWTRQSKIQDFVQEILDHIQGVLYVDPSTGLLTLKLIRDDYDVGTIPELTPDDCDVVSFDRKLWGEVVNEIVVTWTNPDNEKEETVTAQDLASIATQGAVISDTRNYYGVRNSALAAQLAYRDLRSAGQPLAQAEIKVDRTQYALRPASVVKLTYPEYGLSELVMRVTTVDYGAPGNPEITLTLVEDVFGLDVGAYEDPPRSEWEDPSEFPEPMDYVEIITLPYFFALDTTNASFIENPVYPDVLVGILANTDQTDAYSYELWDEVTLSNGSLEWQSLASNNIIGRGTLDGALDAEVTSTGVLASDRTGDTIPTVAGFAIIGDQGETGNEIAMVEAYDEGTGEFTLTRGVLDTIPRAWAAGTPIWFVDTGIVYEDPIIRSAAETVDYRLLPRTSQGLLDLADAPDESETLTERPWLPSRPANVVAYGEAWSTLDTPIDATARPDPWVTVTWSNRNRLSEDTLVLAWDDATTTPETGQTTTIEVRDPDGALLTTHDGLTGTTFDVPDASFSGASIVELRVYSERTDADGDFASLQYFSHWVQVGTLTFDSTGVTFDTGEYTWDEN